MLGFYARRSNLVVYGNKLSIIEGTQEQQIIVTNYEADLSSCYAMSRISRSNSRKLSK